MKYFIAFPIRFKFSISTEWYYLEHCMPPFGSDWHPEMVNFIYEKFHIRFPTWAQLWCPLVVPNWTNLGPNMVMHTLSTLQSGIYPKYLGYKYRTVLTHTHKQQICIIVNVPLSSYQSSLLKIIVKLFIIRMVNLFKWKEQIYLA